MEQEINNQQNNQFNRLLMIFCIILLITSLTFFLVLNSKINKITEHENTTDLPAFSSNSQKEGLLYTIKEYNEKIGIFENESLIYTLDVFVFTLPENDKKLLKDGIEVSSKEELYELLEDYY